MEQNDYFCQICDSHMNSAQMWESHINGKRHLKNIKKEPGEPLSKIRQVKRDDLEPMLLDFLKDVHVPIIGLDKIAELRKLDVSLEPTYACYSCNGSFTRSTIVPHVISTKHRMQYLKEVDLDWFNAVQKMKMKKTHNESLAEEKAYDYEKQHGRGRVQVKVEKSSDVLPVRRSRYVDLDDPNLNTTSTSTSDVPTYDAASMAMPEAKGIEDFDLIRDSGMIGTEMKLEILKYMVDVEPLPVETEEYARQFASIIRSFMMLKVQHRVRQLPPDKFEELYKRVTETDNSTPWTAILNSKGE